MTHQFRLLILIVLSSMLWTSGAAQTSGAAEEEKDYNKFSIEVSGGVHIPMAPTEGINTSDYIGFQQFQTSVRYMLNRKIGLRAYYAFNRFDNGEVGTDKYEGVDLYNIFNRVGIEGILSLGNFFNMNQHFLDKNSILFHTGAGLTFSKPSTTTPNIDRMGMITIGLTPQRKLSKRVAIFADISYIVNFKQHTSYSGVRFKDKKASLGGYGSVSIGLVVYLGSSKEHADWY